MGNRTMYVQQYAPATMRPFHILLVEDNPGDVRLIQEALKESPLPNRLHLVEDGAAAIAFLHRTASHGDAPRPDLILLDLNLPKKTGREVLEEIKQDQELRRIPVIILTTSHSEEDILQAYNLHANCYITKPVDLDQLFQIVRSIEVFWFTVAQLPPE